MPARKKFVATPRTLLVTALALVAMAGGWILLVAGTNPHEMIVGAASILATGVFLIAVHQTSPLHLHFRVADLATGWTIPWQLVQRNTQITVVLFKDLLGIRPAQSLFRVVGFKTSKDAPVLVARRVLATLYSTAAPNFIVIGIDYTQSRMLFHQIERGEVSAMTKKLGAQS
jgi:hypothetical protein